jgi:LemA protein
MTLIGLLVIICLGVLIFWCMFTFNSFRTKQTLIDFWWDEVDAHLQLRRELIPSLLDRARPLMGAQNVVLDSIAGIREEIVRKIINDDSLVLERELEQLENRLSSEMHCLKDAFRGYREAQMNFDLLMAMGELESIEGRAVTACVEYNKLTADFNSSIKRFPANLVVGFLRFNPMKRRIFGEWD